jgi:hypothetical protein
VFKSYGDCQSVCIESGCGLLNAVMCSIELICILKLLYILLGFQSHVPYYASSQVRRGAALLQYLHTGRCRPPRREVERAFRVKNHCMMNLSLSVRQDAVCRL